MIGVWYILCLFVGLVVLQDDDCISEGFYTCTECTSASVNGYQCYWCLQFSPSNGSTPISMCYSPSTCNPISCGACLDSPISTPYSCNSDLDSLRPGALFGIAVGITLLMVLLLWFLGNRYYFCPEVLYQPLENKYYTENKNYYCCRYTENLRTFLCCGIFKSSKIIFNGPILTVYSDRIYYFLILIFAWWPAVPALVIYMGGTPEVSWFLFPLTLASIISYLLFNTKYETTFDGNTRMVTHKTNVGPFSLIPITSTFPFEDIQSIEVCGRFTRFGFMRLLLKNGDTKLILVDGDSSVIRGTYWRIKEDISKHMNLTEFVETSPGNETDSSSIPLLNVT